jgi:serine/threonine-protein kinase
MTAGLYGAAYPVIFAVDEMIFHLVRGAPFSWHEGHLVLFAVVFGATVVFAAARSERVSPPRLLDLALVFQLFGAIGIGMGSLDMTRPSFYREGFQLWGISWVTVWIIAFPFLVPMDPRRAALGAFGAAILGSIAQVVAVNVSAPVPRTADEVIRLVYPQFVGAVIATLGARFIHRMRRDLQFALEMGSYRLERPLGRGGMGEVWLAHHRMLARPAAVKLILPETLGRPADARTALLRFEREARATAGLTSAHAIQIFDFGIADSGVFYYVMELLNGPDLMTLVKEHGAMLPERVVLILRQVCDALADAHARGVIHRDVKPANIVLCARGLDADFVKVLDFGLVFEHGDVHLTGEQHIAGTPGYVSPEAALGRPIDGRADLYGLGAVAYWLLTGRHAFPGDTPTAILLKQVQEDPPRPSLVAAEVPAWLESLVLRCLDRDPDRRPASAQDLEAALAAGVLPNPWTRERAAAWWAEHGPREG